MRVARARGDSKLASLLRSNRTTSKGLGLGFCLLLRFCLRGCFFCCLRGCFILRWLRAKRLVPYPKLKPRYSVISAAGESAPPGEESVVARLARLRLRLRLRSRRFAPRSGRESGRSVLLLMLIGGWSPLTLSLWLAPHIIADLVCGAVYGRKWR